MTRFHYDPIDILLPGGVAMLTLKRLPATQAWSRGLCIELMLKRPWDEDPPPAPDAGLTLRIGRRSFLLHGHQSFF